MTMVAYMGLRFCHDAPCATNWSAAHVFKDCLIQQGGGSDGYLELSPYVFFETSSGNPYTKSANPYTQIRIY